MGEPELRSHTVLDGIWIYTKVLKEVWNNYGILMKWKRMNSIQDGEALVQEEIQSVRSIRPGELYKQHLPLPNQLFRRIHIKKGVSRKSQYDRYNWLPCCFFQSSYFHSVSPCSMDTSLIFWMSSVQFDWRFGPKLPIDCVIDLGFLLFGPCYQIDVFAPIHLVL